MKIAFAATIILALSTAAHAADSTPSRETMAAMGLSEMQILSDAQATAIRGHGFNPAEKLAGFADFQQHKLDFKARAAEFHDKLAVHTFAGAANFTKHKAAFQANVQKFKAKIH